MHLLSVTLVPSGTDGEDAERSSETVHRTYWAPLSKMQKGVQNQRFTSKMHCIPSSPFHSVLPIALRYVPTFPFFSTLLRSMHLPSVTLVRSKKVHRIPSATFHFEDAPGPGALRLQRRCIALHHLTFHPPPDVSLIAKK